MVSEKTAHNYLNAGLFDADITQHFRCQTENFQGCDLPLQKSKRQSDLWEFFAIFPISCLMIVSYYRIKVFNSIDFTKSMHYNPLAYIRNEADILKFVDALISNTTVRSTKATLS